MLGEFLNFFAFGWIFRLFSAFFFFPRAGIPHSALSILTPAVVGAARGSPAGSSCLDLAGFLQAGCGQAAQSTVST